MIPQLQQALEDKSLTSPVRILDKLNIHVRACDARQLSLGDSTIDFITSNTTIEYIPKEILIGIFREFYRIAAPKAIMSHFSPLGDHYADFDHSISYFNFLQYSDSTWKLYNNSLHYQNRLRVSDYRKIHHDTGFTILTETNTKGMENDLGKLKIAEEFNHYSKEDLLVIKSLIVSVCIDK